MRAEEIARLSFEDLMGKAEDARGVQEWGRAIALYTAAIRKADPARSPDKANLARYYLARAAVNKPFGPAVLAEHYASRCPRRPPAPKATDIGSVIDDIFDLRNGNRVNALESFDRLGELHRLDVAGQGTRRQCQDEPRSDPSGHGTVR